MTFTRDAIAGFSASRGSALVASFKITVELKPCLLCGYSPAQARMENAKGIRFRFVCLNIECPNVTDKRTEDGWAHSKQSAAEYWNRVNAPNAGGEPRPNQDV